MHKPAILNGLLVDLEFGKPDNSRFEELRTNLCEKLTLRVAHDPVITIRLEHLHFSQFDQIRNNMKTRDFILLSPQGTPWRSYRGVLRQQLDIFGKLLVETVRSADIPVLGICGGHQFLAMSFGADIDFIDSQFVGSSPETYPVHARAERGLTVLNTLRDDSIFGGVAKHPSTFEVMESHTEEVKNTPYPFVNLARSAISEIQLITIPGTIVYGMAFHPERGWSENISGESDATAGEKLLRNFFNLVYLNRYKAL